MHQIFWSVSHFRTHVSNLHWMSYWLLQKFLLSILALKNFSFNVRDHPMGPILYLRACENCFQTDLKKCEPILKTQFYDYSKCFTNQWPATQVWIAEQKIRHWATGMPSMDLKRTALTVERSCWNGNNDNHLAQRSKGMSSSLFWLLRKGMFERSHENPKCGPTVPGGCHTRGGAWGAGSECVWGGTGSAWWSGVKGHWARCSRGSSHTCWPC